ncbi:MAG: DUF5683 domain-containing protein [Chitinophagales bacterium]
MISKKDESTMKFIFFILLIFLISFSFAQNAPIDSIGIPAQSMLKDTIISKDNTEKIGNKFDSISENFALQYKQQNAKFIHEDSIAQAQTSNKKNKKIGKTKKVDTTHYSPKKAAIWGAAFPGLGQIYNKRYWKLPIVYGILGTVIYFVAANGKSLREFNGYIRNVYDSIPNPAPYTNISLAQIESFRNTYRRNVQIASFGTLFAWGLSIVDAVVDAHLRSFDISDKLTFKVKPQLNYSNFTYYAGIGVHLKIK